MNRYLFIFAVLFSLFAIVADANAYGGGLLRFRQRAVVQKQVIVQKQVVVPVRQQVVVQKFVQPAYVQPVVQHYVQPIVTQAVVQPYVQSYCAPAFTAPVYGQSVIQRQRVVNGGCNAFFAH